MDRGTVGLARACAAAGPRCSRPPLSSEERRTREQEQPNQPNNPTREKGTRNKEQTNKELERLQSVRGSPCQFQVRQFVCSLFLVRPRRWDVRGSRQFAIRVGMFTIPPGSAARRFLRGYRARRSIAKPARSQACAK